MKHEFGYCANCEKEISTACPHCGTRKISGEYTEVAMPLNNGSKMVLAVCLECTAKVFQADKKALMDGIKEAWRHEHLRNRRPHEVLLNHEAAVKGLEFS